MTKVVWLAAVGLVACRGTADIAGTGSSADDMVACKAAAAVVGEAVRKIDIHDGALQAQQMTLVMRSELPRTKFTRIPIVNLLPTQATYMGSVVDDGELGVWLGASHAKTADDVRQGRLEAGTDPDAMFLEIDEAVPWSRVVQTVTTTSRAGYRHVIFVFARTPTPALARPASPVDADLAAALRAPANRAVELSMVMRKAIDPCPALVHLLGIPGHSQALIEGVEPALVECKCAADPASVRAVFVDGMFHNDWPTSDLTLSFDETGTAIANAADARWKDVAPKLEATTKPVWFR